MSPTSVSRFSGPAARRLLPFGGVVLMLGILAASVRWPDYDAILLMYVPVMLIGLVATQPFAALYLAVVASVLGALAAAMAPAGADTAAIGWLNHALAILVTWITAAGVTMYRVASDEHRESVRALEDLRQAIDQSAIVAMTDVSGRIKFVNDKFCEISRYSREELIGQDHRLLNSGFHPGEYIRGLWRTIAQGRVWRGELRNRAKDGTIYWVDTTIVPFLDAHRKPWQYMAIRYDITERKAQEQQLQDQAALAALGEFAAVVAHEVRNPLAGIRNGVQLIASELPSGSDSVSLSRDIVTRVDALNAVIEDLLNFARPREFRPVLVPLRSFLTDIAAAFRYDPAMQHVEVVVEDPSDTSIDTDPDQLRFVFMNLLVNAGQAMGGTGRIDVSVTDAGGDRCAITVADRGPGIPAELAEKVFVPFFTTKHRGTGRGLPTVKRVVEAHHGTVALSPRPGGGTTARVVLPRRQPGAPAR